MIGSKSWNQWLYFMDNTLQYNQSNDTLIYILKTQFLLNFSDKIHFNIWISVLPSNKFYEINTK